MMTLQGSVDWKNADHALENFEASLADNSEALAAVADDLREMIAEQFATEGRAGGTPWAPLAPSTLRRSRRPRSGILVSTGALLGSLRDLGAPGHVEEMSGQTLLFGSRLPYAIFHQTGTGSGFGKLQSPARSSTRKGSPLPKGTGRGRALPMRPMIVMTEARAEHWVDIVRSQIEAKALALGAKELE